MREVFVWKEIKDIVHRGGPENSLEDCVGAFNEDTHVIGTVA